MVAIVAKDFPVLRVNLLVVWLGKNIRRTKHEQSGRIGLESLSYKKRMGRESVWLLVRCK